MAGADKIIFTRAKGNPRAMDPKELLQQFNEVSGKGHIYSFAVVKDHPTAGMALPAASLAAART